MCEWYVGLVSYCCNAGHAAGSPAARCCSLDDLRLMLPTDLSEMLTTFGRIKSWSSSGRRTGCSECLIGYWLLVHQYECIKLLGSVCAVSIHTPVETAKSPESSNESLIMTRTLQTFSTSLLRNVYFFYRPLLLLNLSYKLLVIQIISL